MPPPSPLLAAHRSATVERYRAGQLVFRRADMADLGIDPAIARTMVRRGWWLRLHHGVYCAAEALAPSTTPEQREAVHVAASIAALPHPAFAFGPPAARLHGLSVQSTLPTTIQLVRDLGTDPRALRRRVTTPSSLKDVHIVGHRLAPGSTTTIGGIPCVDRACAAVSTAAMSSLDWAVATMDAAAWQQPGVIQGMHTVVDDWPRLAGIGTVRRALPLVRAGAQSPLESLSRVRLVREGLPEPELQVRFDDEDGLIGYVDMWWPHLRVIGEADGLSKYQTRDDLLREKAREDRLRALGLAIVRWTWREISSDPSAIAAKVRRGHLGAARRSIAAGQGTRNTDPGPSS